MDRDTAIKRIVGSIFVCYLLWGIIDIIRWNVDWIADRFFLALVAGLTYLFYKKLNMSNSTIIAAAVPFVLHTFGWFDLVILGLPFDHYLHFSAGLALGLIFYDYLRMTHSRWSSAALAVCIASGIGSFMEVFEFIGYSIGGEGGGILFYGAGDIGEWNNAARDMLMNTLGSMLTVLLKK